MRLRSFLILPLLVVAAACDDADDTTSTSTSSNASSGSGAGSTSASSTTGASSSASSGAGGAMNKDVTITFGAEVGGEAFDCTKTFTPIGTAPSTITITDFRFYVHDVRLIGPNDAETPVELDQDQLWQHENLALLDFEDKTGACANGTAETNFVVKGTVPEGVYEGIAFKLGVPDALNHLDAAAAPSPLNLSAMFWSWTSGYKYARVDANVMGGGPFLFHLGATGCSGDPVTCTNPNVPEIRFASFKMDQEKIVMDMGDLYAMSNLSMNTDAPGCMSGTTDPECAPIFPRAGLDLATGMPSASPQVLFRVE